MDMDIEENLVFPGDQLNCPPGSMPGFGTYEDKGALYSNVMGYPEQHNKLICVNQLKGKYTGETGNVILGRISQVANKRWKVEVEAASEAVLYLASIDLPSGEHRIRSEEDQLNMREYFSHNELLSAEVSQVAQEGKSLSLQTRSKKFGKLRNGMLVKVNPKLIDQMRHHFVKLEIGVDVVFGRNGLIWVYMDHPEELTVPLGARQQIIRVANILKLLNKALGLISVENVLKCYQATSSMHFSAMLNAGALETVRDVLGD